MSVSVTNSEQFSKAFTALAQLSTRDLATQINFRLLDVGFLAQKMTPKADKARIEGDLDTIYILDQGVYKRGKNAGKFRRKNKRVRRAEAIIQGRRVARRGHAAAYTQAEAISKARRMLGKRLSAIGFSKKGWNKPLQDIKKALLRSGQTYRRKIGRIPQIMRRPGIGIGANPRTKLGKTGAELSYEIGVRREGAIVTDPRTIKAANVAVRRITRKMIFRLARKLNMTFAETTKKYKIHV